MAKFCRHCGSNQETAPCNCSTNNVTASQESGEKLTQPIQQASQQLAEPMQQISNSMQQTVPINIPNVNFDSQKASAMLNDAKQTASSGFSLAQVIIHDMFGHIQRDPASENTKDRCAIGIGHVLSILLIVFVAANTVASSLMGGFEIENAIPLSSKIIMGLYTVFLASLYIVIPAAVSYHMAQKTAPNQKFVDILGVFCICTIPTTILYVVAAIATIIEVKFAMYIIGVAFIIYIIHINEAIITTTKQTKNAALITLIIALSLTGFVEYLSMEICNEKIAEQVQESMMPH